MPPGPLAAGSVISIYRIVGKLGAGGMGEVYRATDSKLQREVALKVLTPEFAQDAGWLSRFEREARVLASINHPHIAAIYGLEESGGIRAIAMELVEGPTLAERIKRKPIPVKEALAIAGQIAEALEYAHEKGIVHRDLKPANVKLRPDGVVKVLDFGLAKAVAVNVDTNADADEVPTLSQTRAGAIMGTPAYMAPEQAAGLPMDRRADIWAFGVVLFEMLSGRKMYGRKTAFDTLAAVARDEPRWEELPAETPPAIVWLLRRCLDKDPKRRLRDIGEARIAIESPDRPVAPVQAATPPGRWWLRTVAVLTAALAVTAAIGWWRANRDMPLRPLMRLRVELGPEMYLKRFPGEATLALSPDGTLLAAAVRGADGENRLTTRQLDRSQSTLLAGTEGALSPFFSPDGEWIGFTADRKIKKISVRGGAVVTLCDASGGITGSWGDDGNIIVALGWGTGLSRVPSAGGAPVPVTALNHEKGEFRHAWPQVLPGSGAVLFSTEHIGQTFDDADIEVVSLKTGERKLLHHGGFFARYLPSGHLVWLHENALYAAPFDLSRLALTGEPQPVVEDVNSSEDTGGDFAFSQTGTLVYISAAEVLQRSIFLLDSAGKTQPLYSAPGLDGFPRFSPDGKRLAFSAGDGKSHEDIWVQDLERGTASRVTLVPGQNQAPVWTPDGKNLVFRSSNPTAPGIYWVRADGSGVAQRLTDGKTWQKPESISPDGKLLAVTEASTGKGVEIWMAPIEGDSAHPRLGKAEPFQRTSFVTINSAFSPDGRWLAYYSGEPGKEGVWVAPFPGPGGAWLVSSGGWDPKWSRGASGAAPRLFILENSRTITAAGYTASGDAFVFGKLQPWSPHLLLDLGSPPVGAYDIAPDGKRAAVVLNADGTADPKPVTHLTFLLNFLDELRRRAPTRAK